MRVEGLKYWVLSGALKALPRMAYIDIRSRVYRRDQSGYD